jgi:multidrug efflux pump subunit AcrA (membrane-fusion protein)
MKPDNRTQKIVITAFCVAALLYFIAYAVRTFRTEVTTTVVHATTVEDAVSGSGLTVRSEKVIETAGDLVSILPTEGETVAKGETLARVYESKEALQEQEALEEKEAELSALQYVLSHSSEDSDTVELGRKIISSIQSIRVRVAKEDLTRLDEEMQELENMIYRQDYTYSGSEAVTREMNSVNQQLKRMRASSSKAISELKASAAGTFSTIVDGYEGILTPDSISGLTPSRLENLRSQRKSIDQKDYLGKIITSKRWYFAAVMSENSVKRMKRKQEVTVRFDDVAGDQPMTVQSISEPEDGQVAVVFTSNRHLHKTSLLRSQNVSVIYDSFNGYRIPKKALHTEEDSYYVYRVSGARLRKVPVSILAETQDYFVVGQYQSGEEQSALEEARQIRDGDAVVIRGSHLYDGKVIGQ